ncbi:DUF305 domain-containing protein [Actinomycetospora lutea]|uniref:DUF305 domain-containing protein n=1 Tax=Actinomycetospora lutea TaxID=663604 RepID=UPI00236717A7|nr:DUF305 domain-containing protein [Actinomycetospora lutea]MDD7939946.1 DUF305 domain-containing protein [Actinomycetospora lutea]
MPRALAVLALCLAVLAGCADAPVAGPGADPDAAFLSAMIPHHEQALALTAMVGGRGASPGLEAIALRIDRAQVEEVGQMQGLARARGLAVTAHHGAHAMSGMAEPATLATLPTLCGPAFERLWLETMIRHHEGAVAMARGYTGTDDTLGRFAQVTVAAQSAEIDAMERLLH